MSASFNGSSDRLNGGVPDLAVNAAPMTVSAWFYPTATMSNSVIAACRDGSSPYQHYAVLIGLSDGAVRWQVAGPSAVFAVSTTSVTLNAWNHAVGIETSTTSRSVYLNGGGKGTNTSFMTFSDVNSHSIGALYWKSATTDWQNFFQGKIAEVAMWNVALTEAEAQSLAVGISPLLVRPASLVHYWPLGGIIQSLYADIITGVLLASASPPSLEEHLGTYTYPVSPHVVNQSNIVAPPVVDLSQNKILGLSLDDFGLGYSNNFLD